MPETNDVISHLYYDLNDKIDSLDQRLDAIDVDAATEPKVYVALLTQSGTSAPVATILKNTLGGVPVWSYVSIGVYRMTLASAFTVDKTNIEKQVVVWADSAVVGDDSYYTLNKISTSIIELVYFFSGVEVDNELNKSFLEIKVYP